MKTLARHCGGCRNLKDARLRGNDVEEHKKLREQMRVYKAQNIEFLKF